MVIKDVILMNTQENSSFWRKIDLSNPSEIINVNFGVDDESVSKNIDSFIKKISPDKFLNGKSFSEVLLNDSFSKRDIIISSFRKYRFVLFDNFKENYEKYKGARDYFTIGALIDDVSLPELNFRLCILIDYIYETDNYALTTVFGVDGIQLSTVTKELLDLYENSIFPCLKLWEIIISGSKSITSLLEERNFLSEKVFYPYCKDKEISSYSVSIQELLQSLEIVNKG